MKNSDKIMNALKQAYPDLKVDVVANLPKQEILLYIDGHYVASFYIGFWEDDIYEKCN